MNRNEGFDVSFSGSTEPRRTSERFKNTAPFSYPDSAILIFLMGIGGELVGILALTWLQQETEISMQGRMIV